MAQFKGDARDAKRARYGARVQEEMKEAFERKVQEMREETDNSLKSLLLDRQFSTDESFSQQKFVDATVGLQTHEEYAAKAKVYLNTNTPADADTVTSPIADEPKDPEPTTKHMLSFGDSDDDFSESELSEEAPKRGLKRKLDDESSKPCKKRKVIGKNPNVNTSFLPDPERDLEDERMRAELEKEWNEQQERIKRERLEITYSFWDGSGHRRSIEVQKGISIGEFLEMVRKDLASQFSELRGISGEYLMYIKDDLIIPHSFQFYDLIITKSIGKSGWEMFKSVSVKATGQDQSEKEKAYDASVVHKDDGHPGKVITRSWYDRNKHIFPASKWEVYDPQIHTKSD